MALDRRAVLKALAGAGATLAAAPAAAVAKEPREAPADAVGMLYDATLCIGCKACVVACRDANYVAPMPAEDRWFAPEQLSEHARTVIKFCRSDEGLPSFMKAQCMHCIDPACASACMLGAFQKRAGGVVTWLADRCVGCRYCQVACPFDVPKFEWTSATPHMIKCEMCAHRLAEGKEPACTEVCPRAAITFGDYRELLAEAHRRLDAEPDRYEPKVYGEFEGGGTQVLFLAPRGIAHTDLGLPDLGPESVPSLPETIQHTIYKGFVAPVALYGILGAVIFRNRRRGDDAEEGDA